MVNTTQNSPSSSEELNRLLAQWRQTVEAELKGVPFEKKLVTRTFEGIALQPLYSRADLAGLPDLYSRPGQVPFLRGRNNLGYKEKLWSVAQEIAASDSTAFNKALLVDLMNGQNAVVITPDVCATAGIDPDQVTPAHVGHGGLSVADVNDMATALKGVALSAVPVHVEVGADARPLAGLLLAAAEKANIAPASLTGSVAADPLGAWAATGSLAGGEEAAFDALADWTKWASKNAPGLATVGVNAAIWQDGGASAAQELGYAMAVAAANIRALQARGVSIAQSVGATRFRFAVGPQFFTEIAKFRAFRLLWSRVVSAFGVDATVSSKSTVHALTGDWNKTLHDAHVNMLRATTEALSAVLGGCDSLHIGPFDEVSGATDEFSRRIARNVHTLLAEEFSFTETADPAGGSWYVEKLTDELARKAWSIFQEIEAAGGFVAALKAGLPQKQIATTAAEKDDAVAKRRYGLIGTNLFPNLKEKVLVVREPDAAWQAMRVKEIKGSRPSKAVAATDMAGALLAAKAGASIGQIAEALRSKAPSVAIAQVPVLRAASGFESLRKASDTALAKTGARPKVFLAKMGPVLQHKARADFSAGFFAVGGFEMIAKQAFDTAAAAATAAAASGAPVAVLCSTDETYPELVPAFTQALKQAKPGIIVVLAGLPADKAVVEQFRAAGIDEFIHIRASVRDLLAKLQKQIGVLA